MYYFSFLCFGFRFNYFHCGNPGSALRLLKSIEVFFSLFQYEVITFNNCGPSYIWFESSSEGDREHFEHRKQGSEEKKSFSQKKDDFSI